MKNNHLVIGKLGEEIACRYLNSKGYKILERNYKNKYAEIDIIALKDDIISIVEVKTRKNKNYIPAREAVNRKKQLKIIKLAHTYIYNNYLDEFNISFDIIECYWENRIINHIVDAFGV